MVWLVVVLAIVAAGAIATALLTRRRLVAQRRLTAGAEQRGEARAAELTTVNNALEAARSDRTSAEHAATTARDEARAFGADRDRARSDVEAATVARRDAEDAVINAERRAAEAERRADAADRRAIVAESGLADAEQRVREAQARSADAEARAAGGVGAAARRTSASGEAEVLWALERDRSQRTWRNSVAHSPDAPSVFGDRHDVLVDAVQIEIDAAREEVGAIVELDSDAPANVSPAASVLALRAAQELLAATMRRAEVTTLSLRTDGSDLLVSAHGVDEHDDPVDPPSLAIPPAHGIEHIDGGIRIRDAIA